MTIDNIIKEFIDEMDYLNNQHVLGVLFYGSFLNGTSHEGSDIDIHVVFDNSEPLKVIRGIKYIKQIKIEYFEKPLWDCYATIVNGFERRKGAWLQIFGTSNIVFERNNAMMMLQNFTRKVYSQPFPKLTVDEAMERKAILDNRMERLHQLVDGDSPTFDYYCDLTIEKIRKLYHDLNGLASISTTKVVRIYTDPEYHKRTQPLPLPDSKFIEMWLDIVCDKSSKAIRFQKLQQFYYYVTRGIDLPEEHRISTISRNINQGVTYPSDELTNLMGDVLDDKNAVLSKK